MQKDVIYIDVEDDITAIIGKLKASKHKIVALVPPKRIGVLQSAVNLRLLARSAEQHDKRLVIITGNHALSGLAASAAIPVAKNLQSKPELAEIAALEVDDGEDVIDGAALPVGDHAKQSEDSKADAADAAVTSIAKAEKPAKPTAKKTTKVPNFDTFRKKLFLGISAGVLLVAFLVWAFVFAPHAKVILLARTTDATVSQQVQLSTAAESSAAKTTLRVEQKQATKEVSVSFDATGKKDVGEKATGTVSFSNASPLTRTIDANTELTSESGKVYRLAAAVTIPGASLAWCGGSPCASPGAASGSIVASGAGESYNGASGTMTGAPSGVTTTISGATSGGTDKTIAVVTKDDVDKAKKQAEDSVDKTGLQKDLAGQFGDSYKVLDATFQLDLGDIKASPAVGAEVASGKGTYAGTATATIYAVSKEELSSYLDAVLEQQLDDTDQQRVYENGADKAEFGNVVREDKQLTISVNSKGKIGPKIDEVKIKELAKGKNYGEIQSALTAINGIAEADIKFSPFWVSKAPNDEKKISIEFKVNE